MEIMYFFQDVDGFLFVYWNAYYHQRMTNKVAVSTVFIMKIFGVIIVGIGSWALPELDITDIFCAYYFSQKAFYFWCIPFLVAFLNSIFIICYMSYTKYEVLKLESIIIKKQSQRTRQKGPPNISGQIEQDVLERHRMSLPRVVWQDPSLWTSSSITCYPPSISIVFKQVKTVVKLNILSFVLLSIALPPTVMMFCYKLWDLKCDDWGSFAEKLAGFEMILALLYPYFVKVKLEKFLLNV